MPGFGGVHNSINLGLYSYGHQKPVKLIDPDGNTVFDNAQQLTAAGNAVLSDASVQPGVNEGATWCNRGVGLIEARGGNTTSYGNGQPGQYLKANAMIDKLKDASFATPITGEQAVAYAQQGVSVIAGQANPNGSGHVAIVAPIAMQRSASLGRDVPSVINIGQSMGTKLVSASFSLDPNRPVGYYIQNDDLATLKNRNNATGKDSSSWDGVSIFGTGNMLTTGGVPATKTLE